MKKTLYFLLGILITMPTFAAREMQRATVVGVTRNMAGATLANDKKSSLKWNQANFTEKLSVEEISTDEPVTPTGRDTREAERTACISNNLGADATFVWASKNSDPTNYATMIEDVQNPENNVCFARVDISSKDIAVNLSDFQSRYFPINSTVTCGDWVNHADLEKRILDAKKTTRTLATIGGAVGGAGIGVGAMELGGNKLLAKSSKLKGLQGQKALSEDELFVSQLKIMKTDNPDQYARIVSQLEALGDACKKLNNNNDCNAIDYAAILNDLDKQ